MKYLGVDYGLKRVGLAISEGEIASPYRVIEIKSLRDGFNKIFSIFHNGNFDKIIVGLPEGAMAKAVTRFVDSLKAKGIDVETADETLSSKQALRDMIETGVGEKKRGLRDDRAAAIILQNYLDTL